MQPTVKNFIIAHTIPPGGSAHIMAAGGFPDSSKALTFPENVPKFTRFEVHM